MKGKVFGARKRLSQLVNRAEKLGLNLQNSSSATALRQACGLADPATSVTLLVLGLGLLTLVLTLTLGHRYLRLSPSLCPPNRTQELHIQTLSWRLLPDEGTEPPVPVDFRQPQLDSAIDQTEGSTPLLQVEDCEDVDQLYGKRGHGKF